jgi:peptidoglycan/LPS O-acetylase OafA/YrhL
VEIPNKPKLSPRPFFPNVNGLRFLGAFAVFIFHSFTLYKENWSNFTESVVFNLAFKVANKGHYGVALFFVLSGFLITSMLLHERKQTGTISVRHFFFRRVLRIWPLYFLLLLFGFVVFPNLPAGITTQHSLTWYALFAANIDEIAVGMNDSLNFLTVLWSVSVEEQFYLAWMFLMLVLPWIKQRKYFLAYAVLLIITSIVFRLLHADDERVLYFHTFSVISDLAIGSIVAYFIHFYTLKSWVEQWSKRSILMGYLLGVTVLFTAHLIFNEALESLERLVIACFFAFVLLEQIFAKNSLFKMDRIPYFAKLGEITYGFYLFHCIYMYYWSLFFNYYQLTTHAGYFAVYILVCFTSTLLTAQLSWRLIEKPILSLKHRLK